MIDRSVAPGDRTVPWLSECRAGWEFQPLKYMCTINKCALSESTDPDFEFRYIDIGCVDSDGNWTSSEPMRFTESPSRARRVLVDGDVLVSTVRTYLRAITHIGKVDEPLVCSTGFAVLSANGAVAPRFLAYWARTVHVVDEVVARSVGVSYPAVNASDIANIPCPVLPLSEQRAIAAFLDRETARIDALTKKKQRQIELLHKKRAALISHAVTKGLDPDVPTKDSGIEWVGTIPEAWNLLQLRRMLLGLEQGWSPVAEDREAETDEWAVLKISAVAQGRFKPREHKALPPTLKPETRYEVRPGDLLITRSNTPERVGDACIVSETRGRLIMSDLIYRLNLDQRRCLHRFACYWLISRPGRAAIEADARGTSGSMVKIAQSHIRAWPLVVPPVEQQAAIVEHLDYELERLGRIVAKIEFSMDRLREYRTALISAAVTGKLDVRQEAVA